MHGMVDEDRLVVHTDPRTVCQAGRVIAPRPRVELMRFVETGQLRSIRLRAVSHGVSWLVFTAGACPLD